MNKLILLGMERVYGIRRTDLRGGQMSHCPKRGEMKLVGQESCYGVFPYIPIFRLHLC